jgi:hypothetical protein
MKVGDDGEEEEDMKMIKRFNCYGFSFFREAVTGAFCNYSEADKKFREQGARLAAQIDMLLQRNDALAKSHLHLEGVLKLAQKDINFYRCCALSGEIPEEGVQPSANKT